jgi:hypothetical protein
MIINNNYTQMMKKRHGIGKVFLKKPWFFITIPPKAGSQSLSVIKYGIATPSAKQKARNDKKVDSSLFLSLLVWVKVSD